MNTFNFTGSFNLDQLRQEIAASSITVALDYLEYISTTLTAVFKANLSSTEQTALSALVSAHTPVFLPDANAVSLDTPKDSSGRPIFTVSPFCDSGGFRFRGASFKDTVATATTKDIDFKLNAERYINGGRLLVNNIGADDKLTFQVIDKDNILGFGAGAVLDEFITDYYVPDNGNLEVRLDYPARIIAGLYIRLKYTSTHASGCTIKCNLYLHWKAA